jgi:hypothetical protein
MLGGNVASSSHREYGHGTLTFGKGSQLLQGLKSLLRIWNSHGDKVTRLPKGFKAVASTENSECAVVEDPKRRFYGIQFHPEVAHSERGIDILRNFLFRICRCRADWKMDDYVDTAVREIRAKVGKAQVILGLSGGVDSSVAAALIQRAIGEQLTCVFVDNGLLRLGERQQVEKMFRGRFKVDLRVVDASAVFLRKLKGVTDPERKRKIIGHEFIKVFERSIAEVQRTKTGKVEFLAQGTLYPDVIESVSPNGGPAAHHQEPPQRGRPARAHEAEAASSRCASCSRTRCARSARPSASRTRWSTATPSRAPASPCASAATSPRSASTSCASADAHLHRRAAHLRPVRQGLAGLRRLPPRPQRRRHGRRPHLRQRLRPPRRRPRPTP